MATKNVIEGSNKVSAAQLKDLFRQIDEGAITGDHIQALLERRSLPEGISEIKSINFNDKLLYKIEVDGTKTLDQLMKEGKFKYDQGRNIFSLSQEFLIFNKSIRKVIIKLFSFEKEISREKIIKKMRSEGFLPSTIEEVLCLGIQKPEVQIISNIVSLGSINDNEEVSYLSRGNKSILLYIDGYYGEEEVLKYKFAGSKIIS